MRLLLDTHVLIWAAAGTLSSKTEKLLTDEGNSLFFSSASIWEITIKAGLNRPDFQLDAALLRQGLLENQYQEIPISSFHALAVKYLPLLHKDPFDRILLAQAQCEGLTFLTSDRILKNYPGSILFVG
ncbi:MAG: type II toxin-antitoxin system VapC family toxin [Synergistaceae bacterium]|nr:type II toxin-antitoxin system VapC family toxin [Synergistaceae bacterium]